MAAPPTFRLDTLAVHLVARLEASRRAHLDDPEAARAAFGRVVAESAAALARECREVLGDEGQARLLEREARETFLPRYTRMALEQSVAEKRGYAFVFGAGPVARVVATVFALALAAFFSRYMPGFLRTLLFVTAASTPFIPEIRVWWARRHWNGQLQELADDLGRVQDAAELLPHESPEASSATAPLARRPRQEA